MEFRSLSCKASTLPSRQSPQPQNVLHKCAHETLFHWCGLFHLWHHVKCSENFGFQIFRLKCSICFYSQLHVVSNLPRLQWVCGRAEGRMLGCLDLSWLLLPSCYAVVTLVAMGIDTRTSLSVALVFWSCPKSQGTGKLHNQNKGPILSVHIPNLQAHVPYWILTPQTHHVTIWLELEAFPGMT